MGKLNLKSLEVGSDGGTINQMGDNTTGGLGGGRLRCKGSLGLYLRCKGSLGLSWRCKGAFGAVF